MSQHERCGNEITDKTRLWFVTWSFIISYYYINYYYLFIYLWFNLRVVYLSIYLAASAGIYFSPACSRRRDAAAGRRRSRRPTRHAPPPALPRQVRPLRLPAGGALPPTESPPSSSPRPPRLLRLRPDNVRRHLLLRRHPPPPRLCLPQRRRLHQALAGNAGRRRSQLNFSCSTGILIIPPPKSKVCSLVLLSPVLCTFLFDASSCIYVSSVQLGWGYFIQCGGVLVLHFVCRDRSSLLIPLFKIVESGSSIDFSPC